MGGFIRALWPCHTAAESTDNATDLCSAEVKQNGNFKVRPPWYVMSPTRLWRIPLVVFLSPTDGGGPVWDFDHQWNKALYIYHFLQSKYAVIHQWVGHHWCIRYIRRNWCTWKIKGLAKAVSSWFCCCPLIHDASWIEPDDLHSNINSTLSFKQDPINHPYAT